MMFSGFFDRAILIIRDPYDAIKAEFTRQKGKGQHTSKITINKFKTEGKTVKQ